MATAEQAPIAAPAFAVVRRGYDPDQVARHLDRVHAETTILAADRAAAVEQAGQLNRQLSSCRRELDAARTEVERLRGELRVLAGPPDTIDSMNERLQVMLRLAKDEFTGMRAEASAQAAAHAAEIIAAVGADPDEFGFGFDESELRGPRNEDDLERMRREAVAERARLDEEAAARRAAVEEEFRQVLTLRCREAMAQLAKLQMEALRSARRVMDEADEQARMVLTDAREVVRRTVDDAQREVDVLQELRSHLATQLDTSRQMLNRAIPEAQAAAAKAAKAAAAAAAAENGDAGATNGSDSNPADRASAQQPSGRASAAAPATGQLPPSAPATEPAAPASTGKHRDEDTVAAQRPAAIPALPAAPAVSTPAGQPSPGDPASPGPHRAEPAGAQATATPAAPATPDVSPAAPAYPGNFRAEHTGAQATAEPARQSSPGVAGQHWQAHAATPQPSPPMVPALASLPVPHGWPVAPTSTAAQPPADAARHATPDPGPAPEQTQPGRPYVGHGTAEASDGPRAQPMRIPPRDPEPSDVPGPSHVPLEEQDPHIARPRRYP
jgi:cell division septum initiation protein DivIVA